MVGSTQNTSPSSGSSLPCAQRSPASQQNASVSTQQGTPTNSQNTPPSYHNIQPQNVAPMQPSAPALQSFQQLPVAQQQQSLLLQPPAPGSNAAPQQQDQPHFTQPRVSPQPISQPRQPSPLQTQINPSAQPFLPAAVAQVNFKPNTEEPRVPKAANGQGVKSSRGNQGSTNAPDGRLCFRCKQPGHLKKDCPELF